MSARTIIETATAHCPYCGAAVKHPGRIEREYGIPREYPTTYACGTVTSPNWRPPVRGKQCTSSFATTPSPEQRKLQGREREMRHVTRDIQRFNGLEGETSAVWQARLAREAAPRSHKRGVGLGDPASEQGRGGARQAAGRGECLRGERGAGCASGHLIAGLTVV
jgi:hypothetical protein